MADQPPTETPNRAPLLDLDTLTARPTVRIDGVPYELRTPDELSILEYHTVGKIGDRMNALESLEVVSDEDEQEYESLLKRLCGRVLMAPAEVKDRLKNGQRVAVSVAFTRLRLTMRPQTGEATTGATTPATAAGPVNPGDAAPQTIGAN